MRGVNLAIVTFAFAVAVDHMIFANNSVNGGYKGAPVKTPQWINPYRPVRYHFLGLTLGDNKQPNPTTAIFCLIAALVLCYLVVNIRRSGTGRRMLAVRSNERAAAAAGINVSGTKILAFAISAFIAGIGGAVIAYRSGNVTADNFDYRQSLVFFAFAYSAESRACRERSRAGSSWRAGSCSTSCSPRRASRPNSRSCSAGSR